MPQIEIRHVEQFARLAVHRALARWAKDGRPYATLVFAYANSGSEPNLDQVDALPFKVITMDADCKHGAMKAASDIARQGATHNKTHLIGVLVRPVPIGPVPLELVVEASDPNGKGLKAATDLNDNMEPVDLQFEPFDSSEVLAPLFKAPESGTSDHPQDEPDDDIPPALAALANMFGGGRIIRLGSIEPPRE